MPAPIGNQYAKGHGYGRPKKNIDISLVEKLAEIQCTNKEIASVVGCSPTTLGDREDLAEIIKNGREKGKTSLRRLQFKLAERSASMAIWLGKQYLGQKEPDPEMKEFAKAAFTEFMEMQKNGGKV